MKKILLATTILGMTAGFAAAEIAFTGEAKAGFAQNGTKANNKGVAGKGLAAYGSTTTTGYNAAAATLGNAADNTVNPYSSFKLSIAATAESDSGLSFGASTSITRGLTYTMANDDGFAAEAGSMGTPSIFVSGDFGKVTLKSDGFKEYQDDNAEKYDLEYTHTIAGFSVGVRTDLNSVAPTAGKSSIKLGYTIGAVALSGAFDEVGDKWGISAAYTMNALTFTLGTDDLERTSLKVAYAANGLSGSVKVAAKGTAAGAIDKWDIEAGYTANGLTVGAATDESAEWKVTGSYDLGGGLTAEAGFNYTDDMFVGAKMSF
jgi:outer membrane protein OmpU